MRRFSTSLFALALMGPLVGTAHAQEDADGNAPWSQADRYYSAEAMEKARKAVQHHAGGQRFWLVMLDRLEVQRREGHDTFVWDGKGYLGTDTNKFYVKSEGHYSFGEEKVEEAEVQALWSHAIAPYWDLQTGLRYDFEPEGLTQGVFGIEGLAPYFFEVDVAGFVSEDGDVTARAEAEYDLLLTQRLILQPRLEFNVSFQDVPKRDLGSGLTDFEAGVRLRYEIEREFAPYLGVAWQGAFGRTADIIEADGGDSDGVAVILGLRTWF